MSSGAGFSRKTVRQNATSGSKTVTRRKVSGAFPAAADAGDRRAAAPLPRSPARPSARRLDGEKAVDELVCLYAAEVWRMIGERDRAVRRQRDGQVAGGIFGGVAQDVVKHAPQRARELPA